LSDADKRKFTAIAGILGPVFFVLQMVGPMLAAFATVTGMMYGQTSGVQADTP